MKQEHSLPLAPFTSFKSGGDAEHAIIFENAKQIEAAINSLSPAWFLGYGSNTLVSDKGLAGTTLIQRGGSIIEEDDLIVADAGVWWDDLITFAIDRGLWGLECTSAIPGGVGAAVVGNIAAYGQAVADTLQWADIYDTIKKEHVRLTVGELQMEYRKSVTLQENRSLLVLRAAFKLNHSPSAPVEYESALVAARKNGDDMMTLEGRRNAIITARSHAGSLWDYRDDTASRTAGSFFRNPLVSHDAAAKLMSHDETGKSRELLEKMNKVHGGDASRVSAAHVLLAAGFVRGQSWGDVRLHPQHVLKIENTGSATSQEIYSVSQHIIDTVKEKLDIELDPEVRFLGEF